MIREVRDYFGHVLDFFCVYFEWVILRVITRNVTHNLHVITRNGNVLFVMRNFLTLILTDKLVLK